MPKNTEPDFIHRKITRGAFRKERSIAIKASINYGPCGNETWY